MRAKGDWGCRPFPLMQSPLPGPADRHNATAVDLNTGYNSLHRSYPRLSPSGSSFDWKRGVNIKNPEVELLATEVAELAGETKTEAIRLALRERKERLARRSFATKRERLRTFLEKEVWPQIPEQYRGVEISKAEREKMLGYGPGGYNE